MKRWAIGVLLTSLAAGFLCAASWNAGFEASPGGGDLASDLDTFINRFKEEVRRRSSVETQWGTGFSTGGDNGLLRLGAARCFIQNGAPANIDGPGAYVAGSGGFSLLPLGTNEPGGTIDLGTGRCWIDLDGVDGVAGNADDRQLNTWVDTVGWVAATATPTSVFAQNIIYNGSFEITDGTGNTASAVIPTAWTIVGVPTFTYTVLAAGSEGLGIAVNVTGVGANSGLQQTLAGLKASTSYIIRGRVNPTVAGDVCSLNVTGGTVSPVTATTTGAGGSFETVQAEVTTTAGAANLIVQLRTTAAGDVCRWDHVTAYESTSGVSKPGFQAMYTTDNVADNTIDAIFGNNPFLSTSLTIPSSGYIVQADASMSAHGETEGVLFRMTRNDCAGGAFSAVTPVVGMSGVTAGPPGTARNVNLNFVDTAPVVGGTCIYRVEVREVAGGTATVNPVVDTTQTGSSLRLMLIPTR